MLFSSPRALVKLSLVCVLLCGVGTRCQAAAAERPNVLFIIADDASRHFGQAYGCDWVETPNIDRLAKEGLVFENAYVPTSKCAPCRAATLLGRNPWQNEDAANHQNYFPAKFIAFGEALAQAGVHAGSAGKVWGPGIAEDANGAKRDFGMPQLSGKGSLGAKFAAFLKSRPSDAPFFFWYGSKDPHRPYKEGAGIAAGKKPSDIDRVPAYWPDNETVRSDMLDYATEVEHFDQEVGELVAEVEKAGELQNTLVIVTSDHGMPFPRVKGHTFDDAHCVPLVACWPAGIVNPGRRVEELISFIDFAPTFIELQKADAAAAGMAPITGRSFVDLLKDKPAHDRPFLLIGRERNDVYARPGSSSGLGYPVRAIRMGDWLYIRNFKPDRWPCGNPELGLKDTDAGPTKQLIENLGTESEYWQHAFGMRPAEQLFNVKEDPDCVRNLIDDPQYASAAGKLRDTMMAELKRQGDPRVLGQGDVFDNYPTVRPAPADWQTGAAAAPAKRRAKR
ncbi:MAG: sulfatase [Planctomycetota bacterium]